MTSSTNIILIGFMGSGKTSIGKRLASVFKYDFLDTDELIAKKAGMPIRELIEQQGEKTFRKLETEVLEKLSDKKNYIISTGGGMILSSKNQELLPQLGTLLWLHASPDILFERAQRNPHHRALLDVEHPRRTFHQLLTARLLLYEALSHVKVDTTALSYHQTIDAITSAIHEHWSTPLS